MHLRYLLTKLVLPLLILAACLDSRAEENPKELSLDLGKGIKLDLVLIPAGTFEMGTTEKEDGHKKSETKHTVTLTKPFYMGKYEVTQEQYEAITSENPSKVKGPTLPVEHMLYDEAVKFCEKLTEKVGKTAQLPTEAQWEYACRAGTTTAFNTGETLTTVDANFNGDVKPAGSADKGENRDKTLPVGSFKPNAWGLYDMHGNVWEWCRDWFDENYYASFKGPALDPEGPIKSSEDPPARVLRGGSYYSWVAEVRSGVRDSLGVTWRNAHGGFRVIVQLDK
jgi:formylglycine-generating enzyme required for sulfatase activity